ncbi:DUF2788 domain-containing protein [Neisseria canis]|uniref:Protein of uncharacterized function (DUF2788) n=1 Tax=Neisseria canis TaxID=493 RepID=A0A1X3CYP5_9NEIS|nr:DUF2788 domain-containing protein [Neisseria canis]OSI12665.1 hypothetical protein BWD07_04285 [Neisseria canis]VEF02687.1 Protein of uncharacterised function (DUF2788) [Neisseria canis]
MTEAEFSTWSLRIGLTVLVVFLGFIVWDLGKKSKAGKFGMFMLFLVLGLGVLGFVFKNVLVEMILLNKN